jgi:hypothetical protein
VSALAAYAAPVPQVVQLKSPALEKVLAGHAEQLSWLVALQGALVMKPAPQAGAQDPV